MTVGPHTHGFAVNMFARALTQNHKCILATATRISSLTTLEAHSSCHSLLPPVQWMMSGAMMKSQHMILVSLNHHFIRTTPELVLVHVLVQTNKFNLPIFGLTFY